MKKEWNLNQNAFDNLLEWLDADRDRAAEKYEAIRLRLIKIFLCRGCSEAEELSDETINRVAVRIGQPLGLSSIDPARYFYDVAQKVHLEYLRQSRRTGTSRDRENNDPITLALTNIEPEYQCLERCLAALPAENRNLVLQYYQYEREAKLEQRKRMAAELGIAVNALRIRAYRIRLLLQRCVQECLKESML